MQCAQIEIQKTKKQQFGAISEGAGKAGGVEEAMSRIGGNQVADSDDKDNSFQDKDPMSVFKNFYIFPAEYLSLALNAKNRLNEIKSSYNPGTNITKTEHTVIKGEHRYVLYDLKPENFRKDIRPQTQVKNDLENDFYTNVPTQDEGQALSNTEAGCNIDHVNKKLTIN